MDLTSLPTRVDDMPFDTYLADPAPEPSLTSSIIRALIGTAPRAVWHDTQRLNPDYEPNERDIFDLGSAAHEQLIGGGRGIEVIEADSFRTKYAKEAKAAARLAGLTPILEKNMDRVHAMAEAARVQFAQNPDIGFLFESDAAFATHCVAESTVFWRESGITCRCRPDIFAPMATSDDSPIVVHYKTTGMELSAHTLSRYVAGAGWAITTAHYDAGFAALTGHDPQQYFALQSNKPPYLARVLKLHDHFVATGEMVRERAIATWARCVRSGFWPGHAAGTLVVECPPWHENTMVEIKDRRTETVDAKMIELAQAAGIWPADYRRSNAI